MKVKLENREYELKANGSFLLKYQKTFNRNALLDLYKSASEKDALSCEMLTYCAINEEMPFEEWLDSFESPLFILPVMDEVMEYFIRNVTPSVESKAKSNEKKTQN